MTEEDTYPTWYYYCFAGNIVKKPELVIEKTEKDPLELRDKPIVEIDRYRIMDQNFEWTYVHSHEGLLYFYQRNRIFPNFIETAVERVWSEDRAACFEVIRFMNKYAVRFLERDYDDFSNGYYRDAHGVSRIISDTVQEAMDEAKAILSDLAEKKE